MDELRPGGRFGEYLVDSVLGQGGMGIVYRARHERLGRQVALKVLPIHLAGSAEYRARFQAEIRAEVPGASVRPRGQRRLRDRRRS